MSVGTWLVAQTKPHRERWAAENVGRQGFRWYLPMTQSSKALNRKLHPVCLFPRYLFVLTEGPWRSIQGTYGVTGVVMAGEAPAIVPERAIESIRAREGSDGLVHLPDASGGRFKPGEAVRVNGGVFSGYKGIFQGLSGGERSRVLVEFLGRHTSVLIGDEHLEVD